MYSTIEIDVYMTLELLPLTKWIIDFIGCLDVNIELFVSIKGLVAISAVLWCVSLRVVVLEIQQYPTL